MREVDINSYWPEIVRDTEQFGQIAVAENPEFNRIAKCIFQVLEDSFIKSGSEYAVERWESMLQLAPSASDTLETRKARILTYLNTQTPYTVRILNQLIKGVVGDDDYSFEYNNDTQTLTIRISTDFETTVRDLASRVIPMNLTVEYDFTELPYGYLATAFLDSSAQYINTNYIPTATTGMWADGYQKIHGGSIMGHYTAGSLRACVPYSTNDTTIYFFFGTANKTSSAQATLGKRRIVSINYKNTRTAVWGDSSYAAPMNGTGFTDPITLFGYGSNSKKSVLYSAQITEGYEVKHIFIPAITPTGRPCMFDTVTKTPYHNAGSGEFVAGFTVEQARKLGRLPSTGGTLTISLPSSIVSGDTVTDSAVNSALTTARANGWIISVQTYTEEAASAASTFGLRRIWVRKVQDDNGSYVDAEGNRWQVDWCVTMYTPDNSTPDMHGYELFRSVEAATEYWELTQYVDPNAEQELLTEGE